MAPLQGAGGRFVHADPVPVVRSKKRLWWEEKQRRPRMRVTDQQLALVKAAAKQAALLAGRPVPRNRPTPPALPLALPPVGSRILPITTLFSVHLREALPLLPGVNAYPAFRNLLRDHYSNQATDVDPALLDAITRAALKFKSNRVELVSGYRSPKYNLSLRKKGHQVAQTSQHCEGKAADFRLRGVSTKDLWAFVRSLNLGGVGIYPHSAFVHCDTGPVRFWKGD